MNRFPAAVQLMEMKPGWVGHEASSFGQTQTFAHMNFFFWSTCINCRSSSRCWSFSTSAVAILRAWSPFEELVQEATRDAATEDALPLLAFAMRELYDRFGRGGHLDLAHYRALGDPAAGLSPLENAVRRAADDVLGQSKPTDDELAALRNAFVSALVRVDEAGNYVRQTAAWSELPASAHRLLEGLVNGRLLVRRKVGEANVVEVTHEALLRKWPRLRAWLDEERAFLIGRQRLEADLREWEQASATDKLNAS